MKLLQGIQEYVEEKRATGMSFSKGNKNLISFWRFVGDVHLNNIDPEQIVNFLDGPGTSDLTWASKYNLLRGFFLFWIARDLMRSLPMPPPRRPAKRTSIPYIYSQGEVRHLLKSTRASQANPSCHIEARTLRTFLLFLYGTGALVSEAVRITREDIDFKRRFVVIRNNRLEPSRTIPIGSDLHRSLKSYCNYHHQQGQGTRQFFLSNDGKPLTEGLLNETFQRLRRCAGIARHDGIAQPPRMHDLRYTFAVHRLTAWHKHGANLNRMIPALSVYMGYMNLSAAARFLHLTPERFRAQLDKLSPRRRTRHWRDDSALMHFLSTL
jgi:site-specific recombinase XerD